MGVAGEVGRAAGGGRATATEWVRGPTTRVASSAGAGDGGDRAAGVLVGPAVGMLCLRTAEAHLVEC